MKVLLLVCLLAFICFVKIYPQNKADLETQRKRTLDEIAFVDNLLNNTAKEKTESINALKILGNKVNLRETVINGMAQEIDLFNQRIGLNRLGMELMENDLIMLKNDYKRAIINSYKSEKTNPEIVYILSSRDFNQGYKRLKYLQQVSRFRRNEAEIIQELKEQIKETKEKLENDLSKLTDLRSKEEQQKSLLQGEQQRKQKMVKSLSTKEKQLQRELAEKKKIAKRLESEISRIIEEERKRSVKTDMTPEQRLIGENFVENRGRLPWPTERGIITSKFGVHQHPVLKYVTEENVGIEITSSGKTIARSVFKGVVTAITSISGTNMTIVISHGKYRSVYSNIVNVRVKKGDLVETKQELGEIFIEAGGVNNCILKFMIYDEKFLDPELWITKN